MLEIQSPIINRTLVPASIPMLESSLDNTHTWGNRGKKTIRALPICLNASVLLVWKPLTTTATILWSGAHILFVTSQLLPPHRKQAFLRNCSSKFQPPIEMSWLRGKKGSVTNLKAEDANSNRSTTPTPGNPGGKREKRLFRSGLLTIRVMWAQGLALPQGAPLPRAVQMALTSQQAKVAASISPSSVTKHRQQSRSRGNRCVHKSSKKLALFADD